MATHCVYRTSIARQAKSYAVSPNLPSPTARPGQQKRVYGLYTHFNRAGETVHEANFPTAGLVPPVIRLRYPGCSPRCRTSFRRKRHTSTTPAPSCSHSPQSGRRSGVRSGPTIHGND